jgi:hypothetical protein
MCQHKALNTPTLADVLHSYILTAVAWEGKRQGNEIHPDLVLRPFVLRLLALTPLANLHYLLICIWLVYFHLFFFSFCLQTPR